MNTLITAVISMIAGGFIAAVISHFTPSWLASIKESMPKKKRQRLIMQMAIKYPFFAASICCIYFLIPFGKVFVVSMCVTFLVTAYFLARDMFTYSLSRFNILLERDLLEKDLRLWTNQLAMCDRKDKERIDMITGKIEKFRTEIDML